MNSHSALLEVKGLRTYFFLEEGIVRAVDDVNLTVQRGQTLGIVGESGCGKSVTAQSILQIVPPPGKIVEGQILYHRLRDNGKGAVEVIDLARLHPKGKAMRAIRGNEIAMVFQEPMTSLSPVHTIGNQIMEAITLHQRVVKAEARNRAIEMLRQVRIPDPERRLNDYPYQLSGGMRQRALIAMALSCYPGLLIADEPTTALDVTTEAQILELVRELQHQLGMAVLYITHSLGVVAEMATDVVVMYLGKVVETGAVDAIFYDPKHPYTRALLKAIPRIGPKSRQKLDVIPGMVPHAYALPSGCPFHPRCSEFMSGVCDQKEPGLIRVNPGHDVCCHLYV